MMDDKGKRRALILTEREMCAALAANLGHEDVAQAIRDRTATMGRAGMPYDPNLGDAICAQIADGKTLAEICSTDGMPSTDTLYKWLAAAPHFTASYARARDQCMDRWADEIIAIADDAAGDYYEDDQGNQKFDNQNPQRSKLRIDTRKWVMSKISRRYADKVEIEQTVTLQDEPDNMIQARVEARMARMGMVLAAPILTLGHEKAPTDDPIGELSGE
jgi:hypothetical protein